MAKNQKRDLRLQMRRILSNLDSRWLRAAGKSLCEHLSSLTQEENKNSIEHILGWIHFFPGEPDLSLYFSEQLESRAVYLPRTHEDGSMTFVSIGTNWTEQLEAGSFGIAEPKSESGKPYDPKDAERTLILVPGLAFDKEGNRLGRGRGYYDRFLGKRSSKGMTKVGIGWSVQILEHVPSEPQDILMDWVCHEEGFIRTGLPYEESDDSGV